MDILQNLMESLTRTVEALKAAKAKLRHYINMQDFVLEYPVSPYTVGVIVRYPQTFAHIMLVCNKNVSAHIKNKRDLDLKPTLKHLHQIHLNLPVHCNLSAFKRDCNRLDGYQEM